MTAPGRLVADTEHGTYSIPGLWADRRMPTLDHLGQFLDGGMTHPATMLALMALAHGNDRAKLNAAAARPDILAAYYLWSTMTPLVPVVDAHGPTMRQLLDALAAVDAEPAP